MTGVDMTDVDMTGMIEPPTTSFASRLDGLMEGTLSDADAATLMDDALTGAMDPIRLAAVLAILRVKGVTASQLAAFATTMRRHSRRIPAPDGPVLDTCGTGGAPRKTCNISTAAAFALAAEATVAKHGNRSVTRPSGSADVLEAAGADLDLDPDAVARVLRRTGVAFLFAPVFHPAMKHAVPVREALGVKTVFNLLGPLTNPAGATHQVLGVWHPDLVPLVADALARLGGTGIVLHGTHDGAPGFDEATPCGPVVYAEARDGRAGTVQRLDPTDLGLSPRRPEELAPVPRDHAPDLLRSLLRGDGPQPMQDTLALNIAFGLRALDRVPDLATGLEQARARLASGIGNAKMDAYLAATRSPP